MNTELNEAAENYFNTHRQTFKGIIACEYLDKEDFLNYAAQFKAEQKQLLKEKDEQIKELIEALRILLLNYEMTFTLEGNNPNDAASIIRAKSILQKHNSINQYKRSPLC